MGDHDPWGDLEGEVGSYQGIVVESGSVHHVGQPHQRCVSHFQGGVVEGVAETVQRKLSVTADPERRHQQSNGFY